MARADRHEIHAGGYPTFSAEWLRKYGYRSALTASNTAYHVGAGRIAMYASLLFHRVGEPLQMAQVGDTLRYDGRKKIVVIDYREEENVAP